MMVFPVCRTGSLPGRAGCSYPIRAAIPNAPRTVGVVVVEVAPMEFNQIERLGGVVVVVVDKVGIEEYPLPVIIVPDLYD